jgi:uncharacterized YigZ family protein
VTLEAGDRYVTIAARAAVEIKRKGSRFIAETYLVETPEEAAARLDEVRRREHAATHHCFAYRTGRDDATGFKYSDDGEPSGTAGRPIFDVLCGRDLTDTLVVVTRYFGGTKLGTGGLVRAYSDAASEALEASGAAEHFIMAELEVDLEFSCYDLLMKTVSRLGASQTEADFSDRVRVRLQIRRSLAQRLVDDIIQLSQGQAKVHRAR